MRKTYLLFLFFTILTGIAAPVYAQITLVPDPKFEQALIDLGLDVGPVNGSVPRTNISGVTSIDVANRNITDLTGIQDFVSLTRLLCNTNNLTRLDISKNTALTGLLCDRNQLTALDVSKNTALVSLLCTNNKIKALDVTKNTELKNFGCDDNQLTALDISRNTAMTSFGCGNNLLTSLDVTKNIALTSFGCDNNFITSLDISKNISLTSFGCSNNKISVLDVTKNSVLYSLECFGNLLAGLDVTKNHNLTTLSCSGNRLTSLDLQKNTALIYLRCAGNQLSCLDVSANMELTEISCNNNQLACLNLKNGFNAVIGIMNATNNVALSCIQVDDEIAAAGYTGWSKDAAAQYNTLCKPSITYFIPTAACTGDTITITGCNFNFTSTVNFGGIAAASFTIVSATGIKATVGNGASGNVDISAAGGTATTPGFTLKTLTAPATLNISASANNICPADAVLFTAMPANTGTTPSYQWKLNGADVGGNSIQFNSNNFLNNDKVYCIMNTVKTCPATTLVYSDTVTMIVKPVPNISFDPADPAISSGSSIQLRAIVSGNVASYLWTPSTGLNDPLSLIPVAHPTATTTYRFTVISTNNCSIDKKLTVTVFEKIYIPNSFTPNGDTKNDIFRIPPGINFNLENLLLYDRYGNTIFSSTDINKGWDGTYKGIQCPQGTYTYLIKGTDAKGTVLLKGSILLIR